VDIPKQPLHILMENNPFISSSVGDPWVSRYPNVPDINYHAFSGILSLMGQKSEHSALNCACLILGEVGSGKTHLIGQMLEHGRKADFPFTYAYIQPIEDAHTPFSYLLRETIVNLCHPLDRTIGATSWDTQLFRLIIHILKDVDSTYKVPASLHSGITHKADSARKQSAGIFQKLQHKILDLSKLSRFNTIAAQSNKYLNRIHKKAIDSIRKTYPEISKRFLQVLFSYTQPEKQATAIEWLKGNVLDPEECTLLHVPDRSQKSRSALENEAREILTSLGILLGRYKMPMLVCFDRLENLTSDDQIHALGKMMEFLVDKVQAMLPLGCFRGQQWEEKYRNKLNQHIISRLENNQYELQACSVEQAIQIIESRLNSVLDHTWPDLYPFTRQELINLYKDRLYSPRAVITIANERLRDRLNQQPQKILTPLETLVKAYEQKKQDIFRDMDLYPPDRSRLRKALNLFMNLRPMNNIFGRIASIQNHNDNSEQIDLVITLNHPSGKKVPVIFIIDHELHHMSVTSRIQTGITCLIDNSPTKVIYIRDARCTFPPPPKWKETNNKLQRFKRLGGHAIFLGLDNAAWWYSLALLSYEVNEGDVSVLNRNLQTRAVNWKEFEEFVCQHIKGETYLAFQNLESALAAPPTEKFSVVGLRNKLAA
jgi:GTPase SAR1 family protein